MTDEKRKIWIAVIVFGGILLLLLAAALRGVGGILTRDSSHFSIGW